MTGTIIAFFAVALAIIVPGIGSAIAVSKAGQKAAGVCSEKPELYSKVQVLVFLPATQGIYGFLVAFMMFSQITGGGQFATMSSGMGWAYIGAALPVAIVGFLSALYQSKVCVAGMAMVAKQPSTSGRAIIMGGLVETYAIIALIISIFMLLAI